LQALVQRAEQLAEVRDRARRLRDAIGAGLRALASPRQLGGLALPLALALERPGDEREPDHRGGERRRGGARQGRAAGGCRDLAPASEAPRCSPVRSTSSGRMGPVSAGRYAACNKGARARPGTSRAAAGGSMFGQGRWRTCALVALVTALASSQVATAQETSRYSLQGFGG
jgi:hypothetical protein